MVRSLSFDTKWMKSAGNCRQPRDHPDPSHNRVEVRLVVERNVRASSPSSITRANVSTALLVCVARLGNYRQVAPLGLSAFRQQAKKRLDRAASRHDWAHKSTTLGVLEKTVRLEATKNAHPPQTPRGGPKDLEALQSHWPCAAIGSCGSALGSQSCAAQIRRRRGAAANFLRLGRGAHMAPHLLLSHVCLLPAPLVRPAPASGATRTATRGVQTGGPRMRSLHTWGQRRRCASALRSPLEGSGCIRGPAPVRALFSTEL